MSTTPPDDDDDRTRIVPPSPGPAPSAPQTSFPPTELDRALAPTQLTPVTPHLDATPAPPPAPRPNTASASSAGDSGNALPMGTYLSEFELTGVIGEGGFGIVYHAWDHSLQRKVALKEYMPASLASREGATVKVRSQRHKETFDAGLKSFINEARLLAQFDHPSLVKVYRFWEANGTAYMVMPLYVGTTLKDKLRALGGRPDEDWLMGLLAPLTEALQVIHRENCFHRDIAPDNVILLEGSERPLLLDFGAARRVIGDMTQALTVILKPGYAPVEQYAESPDMKQGAWTDVYALAATVHWAILGRTPPPSVSRLMNDSFEPLSSTAAGMYSEGFLQAIDRALAVRPEQRTPSIEALRADLGLAPAAAADPVTQRLAPGSGATQAVPRSAAPSAGARAEAHEKTVRVEPRRGQTTPDAAAAAPAGKSMVWVGAGAALVVASAVGGFLVFGGKPAPAPVAAAPAPTPAPAAVAVPAPPPAPPRFDIRDQFEKVVGSQTPGFVVAAEPSKTQLRVDRDNLTLGITPSRDGFVHVLVRGPSGTLLMLYPSQNDKDNRVKAGKRWQSPAWPVSDPTGVEEFLVFVSGSARDFSGLSQEREFGFLKLPTGDRASAMLAGWTGATPWLLGAPAKDCQGPDCDSFGAAMFSVEVVR